jgi:hypothetical protein
MHIIGVESLPHLVIPRRCANTIQRRLWYHRRQHFFEHFVDFFALLVGRKFPRNISAVLLRWREKMKIRLVIAVNVVDDDHSELFDPVGSHNRKVCLQFE